MLNTVPFLSRSVEDGQSEGLADAGDGLEQSVIAGGEAAGGFDELGFEVGDHRVVMADGGQVGVEVEAVRGLGQKQKRHSQTTVRSCFQRAIFLRKKAKSLCWMFWWRSF
jgi:hypothetical protein